MPEAPGGSFGSLEIAVELEHDCVAPGGQQTITIVTAPNNGVAYHAIYSDGKNGFDPDYYGGNNGGQADASGTYTDTWIVGAAAPSGPVRVDVVAQSATDNGYERAEFAVADSDGTCPS